MSKTNVSTKEKRNIFVFIAVSLSIGWIGVLINILLGEKQEVESLGSLIWLLTPVIISVVFRIKEKSFSQSGIRPNFKGNLLPYLVSVGIFPIVTFITLLAAYISGQLTINRIPYGELLSLMFVCIGVNLFKNIAEEFAWRGYLTDKLIRLGLSDWAVYLVAGLVWNTWHAAYYLFFLPDEYFGQFSERIMFLLCGYPVLIVWSFLFGEIYRITKSAWPLVILHAVEDGVPTMLTMTGGYMKLTKGASYIFNPTTGLLSVVLILAAAFILRRRRKRILG